MRRVIVSRPGVAACLLAVFWYGCSGRFDDGLSKFPVRGKVAVDGKPVAGVIVRFFGNSSDGGGNNSQFPVGITNELGEFKVSTNGENDGAVPGEYDVTVVWPETNEPPLRDRLGGAYSTPEKAQLHFKVEAQENELPIIRITTLKARVAEPVIRHPADQ